MKKIITFSLVALFAATAFCGTRTRWEDGPGSQGYLVWYDSATPATDLIKVGATSVTTTMQLPTVQNILATEVLDATDGTVITVDSTAGAVALTLPDASDVLGATYKILFVTDGGDLTILRAGTDTFNSTGNTLLTGADAEDFLVLVAVSSNRWLIQSNTGFAASTP